MADNDSNLFRDLYPGITKKTRLLIIDYDVCRYHSLDLLLYELTQARIKNDKKHFSSLYYRYKGMYLVTSDIYRKIWYAQRYIREFNVLECFTDHEEYYGATTPEMYTEHLNKMLRDESSHIIPTDINYNFNALFHRDNVDGYILRNKYDRNHPIYTNMLTVYETDNILDISLAASIIIKHNINALMVSSALMGLGIIGILVNHGYTDPITFMFGKYGYNYKYSDEMDDPLYPDYREFTYPLELQYKHEFGYFDPFTKLNDQVNASINLYMEEQNNNDTG